MIPIDVTTDEGTLAIEEKLARVAKLSMRREINLRVSRNLRTEFFLEGRLTALFSTIARAHDLTITDWHRYWSSEAIDKYFVESVVGIAAVLHAGRVTNIAGVDLPTTKGAILNRIAVMGGLLEHGIAAARGKSLTFCAFDPEWPEPAALAGTLNRKQLFRRTFEKYRQDYLETTAGAEQTAATREADTRLVDFIFELYQNTYEHGRRIRQNGETIASFRYIRMRKYIDRRENFLSRSRQFVELAAYLDAVLPHGEFKLYEITVADDGLGLLTQFLQSRRDFAVPASAEEKIELMNRLLTTSLSSKPDYPGTGRGLPNVLEAIGALEGFISVRTDDLWMCGHYAGEPGGLPASGLQPARVSAPLAPIAGTQYNILLPLRRR
jgi:hypothetical protein